ncbi:magnesium transporter [Roseomonas frigidaquae]|uniref:Magnesium transporter n=1 Tax=Falsiroseomonas frigidaquae TaxID=487318 RepID=A0ABX1F8A1_9PROT|nr:magnesium transporter [Falsiroseomonas frigidaquae]NKE48602.1 magnesium transporter [Falsiroseomonas frigidaquae]
MKQDAPPVSGAPASRIARSVSAYIDAAVPVAGPGETVGAVRSLISTTGFVAVDPIFVLGPGRALLGAVRLTTLLAAADATPLAELAEPAWPQVSVTRTCEEAASLAIRHEVPALAVLDPAGAFLGALTATSVMAILRDEHLEDLHHMAGILGRSEQARAALTAPPFRRALYRLPWLLVGLAGSAAATAVMAGAEAKLSAHIAVAFFIPAIVYLADAIGTQAEAVAVRGLSFTDGGPLRLLLGELGTGVLLGVTLATLSFGAVWAVFGDPRLALAVALALAAAGTIATGVGFLLPWAFQRTGLDPALGSGPVATVVQDVLSLAVYFGLVGLLLT